MKQKNLIMLLAALLAFGGGATAKTLSLLPPVEERVTSTRQSIPNVNNLQTMTNASVYSCLVSQKSHHKGTPCK